MMQNSGPAGCSARAPSQRPRCSQPHSSMPSSRRLPPLPLRTSSEPRLGSRSCSVSASASWMRKPPRQSTTISARRRHPWRCSPVRRMTATISSTVGGSAGSELAFITRRATGVIAQKGRGRAAPTGGIENYGHGHGISSQSHSGQLPCSTNAGASPSAPGQTARSLPPDKAQADGRWARRPRLVHAGSSDACLGETLATTRDAAPARWLSARLGRMHAGPRPMFLTGKVPPPPRIASRDGGAGPQARFSRPSRTTIWPGNSTSTPCDNRPRYLESTEAPGDAGRAALHPSVRPSTPIGGALLPRAEQSRRFGLAASALLSAASWTCRPPGRHPDNCPCRRTNCGFASAARALGRRRRRRERRWLDRRNAGRVGCTRCREERREHLLRAGRLEASRSGRSRQSRRPSSWAASAPLSAPGFRRRDAGGSGPRAAGSGSCSSLPPAVQRAPSEPATRGRRRQGVASTCRAGASTESG